MALNFILSLFAFASEGGGGLLDINPGVFVWTVITFVLLFFILLKFAWKPILKSLDDRENFIKNSIDKAENARIEAEKLVEENKANLAKADEEAQKIIEQGREYAEKMKAQTIEQSKAEAKKLIDDAKAEIIRKNQEAFNQLKDEIAGIAIDAAEKIIRENLDREKQAKLVNKLIDELPKN